MISRSEIKNLGKLIINIKKSILFTIDGIDIWIQKHTHNGPHFSSNRSSENYNSYTQNGLPNVYSSLSQPQIEKLKFSMEEWLFKSL